MEKIKEERRIGRCRGEENERRRKVRRKGRRK